METSETILFYEKCRLCLENPGAKHIFETQDLQQDIFYCTGVKVTPSDNLPQEICSKCLDVVTKAKELRLLAGKNETIMKSLFLNDHDDDSKDTLYIVDYSMEEDDNSPQTQEPEVLNKSQQKRKNNTAENSDDNENGDSLNKNKVKVRKDLFNTTSTNNIVTVRSKEDYDRYKKQIKLEPGITVVYECEACEKEFETYKKLYLHIRLHNKNIFCPLDACGKKFATKGDLDKHLRTHTGVRPFTCEVCDKSFTQQGTLKAHKENVHCSYIIPVKVQAI